MAGSEALCNPNTPRYSNRLHFLGNRFLFASNHHVGLDSIFFGKREEAPLTNVC